ncbi:MAG: MmgE/PrpD family protein, partial [Nitrososphaerales archaeon]|nr:MmgE/PrpD family protein [Nitrososphaerales archaeon]
MGSISEYLSNYVEGIDFSDIDDEAIQMVKRCILDTLACILYGFSSPSATITRSFSLKSSTKEEATIIGVNKRSSCVGAMLANGVALRQSEYMDYLAIPISDFVSLIHPSETIPVALAVSERENSSGEDFLLSVFIGYELSGRFCASIRSSSLSAKGWHFSTLSYSILPLVIGKLLKMNSEQLTNALGISACQATLGIIDAEGEEYSMVKNIACPISAQVAFTATLLAQNGFTGSKRVFEGEKGFIKSVLREEVELDELLKGRSRPWILETRLKPYPVCGAALGIADATVNLARNCQIDPLEVDS